MKIHLCVESSSDGKEYVFKDKVKSGFDGVTYQLYSNSVASIGSLWNELSLLPEDSYVIFISSEDDVVISAEIGDIDSTVALYLLISEPTKTFPHVVSSPFAMSKFYESCYFNDHFMLRADFCKMVTPNLSFGVAWYLDIIMELLYAKNISTKVFSRSIVQNERSESLTVALRCSVRLNIIPTKYGYALSDMVVMSESRAEQVRRTRVERAIRRFSMALPMLFFKNMLKPAKYGMAYHAVVFKSKYEDNWNNIPIIINNYNRLDFLLQLIGSLEKRGIHNIHILDNSSTYPPLLEYYKTTPYQVHHLGGNLGHKALWLSPVYELFKDDFFVYTDPDLVINDGCPDDFMEYFVNLHRKYPLICKVGFSLSIDDIPDCFLKKREVQHWESQFADLEIERGVYYAPIDTTFALYKPFGVKDMGDCFRVAGRYSMRHLPWYIDSSNLDKEEIYYINSCVRDTHWSVFK